MENCWPWNSTSCKRPQASASAHTLSPRMISGDGDPVQWNVRPASFRCFDSTTRAAENHQHGIVERAIAATRCTAEAAYGEEEATGATGSQHQNSEKSWRSLKNKILKWLSINMNACGSHITIHSPSPIGWGDFQRVHIDFVFLILRCEPFGKHQTHVYLLRLNHWYVCRCIIAHCAQVHLHPPVLLHNIRVVVFARVLHPSPQYKR